VCLKSILYCDDDDDNVEQAAAAQNDNVDMDITEEIVQLFKSNSVGQHLVMFGNEFRNKLADCLGLPACSEDKTRVRLCTMLVQQFESSHDDAYEHSYGYLEELLLKRSGPHGMVGLEEVYSADKIDGSSCPYVQVVLDLVNDVKLAKMKNNKAKMFVVFDNPIAQTTFAQTATLLVCLFLLYKIVVD